MADQQQSSRVLRQRGPKGKVSKGKAPAVAADDSDAETSHSQETEEDPHGPATVLPDERDDLHTIIDALRKSTAKATEKHAAVLRNEWRNAIWVYCKSSPPAKFPRWIVGALSETAIQPYLHAEFGVENVTYMWRQRLRDTNKRFATWLGLEFPESLALWFGADDVRSPKEKTFKHLAQAIMRRDQDATKFDDEYYALIIEKWSDRTNMDLDTRTGRAHAIFARFPGAHGTKSLTLARKDVAMLVSREGGGDEEGEMAEDAGGGEVVVNAGSERDDDDAEVEDDDEAEIEDDDEVDDELGEQSETEDHDNQQEPDEVDRSASIEFGRPASPADEDMLATPLRAHMYTASPDNSPLDDVPIHKSKRPSSVDIQDMDTIKRGKLSEAGLDRRVQNLEILESVTGWLNDEIMDEFTELFAFSSRDCTTISTLKLKIGLNDDDDMAIRFKPLSARDQAPKTAILCVNLAGNHWVCVSVGLADGKGLVYDSMPTSGSLAEVQGQVANLQPLLMQTLGSIDLTRAECVRQLDTHSCGVLALVSACFVAAGLEVPTTVDANLWRKVFLAIAKETSLDSLLPQQSKTVVKEIPSFPDDHDDAAQGDVPGVFLDDDQEHSVERERSPVTMLLWHQKQAEEHRRRAARLRDAIVVEYTSRSDSARSLLSSVRTANAATSRLSQLAETEAKHLTDSLVRIGEEETCLRDIECRILSGQTDFEFSSGAGTLSGVHRDMDTIRGIRRYQELRLQNSNLVVRSVASLDLGTLMSTLEHTVRGYEQLVVRVRSN